MQAEIVNYIKEAQKHGLTDLEIKQNLLSAGWEAGMVEESFAFVKAQETKPLANQDEDIKLNFKAERTPQFAAASRVHPSAAVQHPQVAAASPQVTMSEQHFAETSGPSFFKKPALWIALIAVLVIGAGGYYAYAYVLNNPVKAWKRFASSGKNAVYENKFKLEYADKGSLDKSAAPLGLELKDMKLSFNGEMYLKATDPNNPESKSTVQYSFSSGNTGFSTGFSYMLQNKVLYLKVDDNPFLNNIINAVAGGQKVSWIKLDLNALEAEINNGSQENANTIKEILDPGLKEDLTKIWEDTTLVQVDKYLGKETINGVSAYHFKNSVDKQAIKDIFAKYADRIYNAAKDKNQSVKEEDIQSIKLAIAALVDKMQITEFETWIGAKDFKLYRVHFVSNAPSFISLVKILSADGGSGIFDPFGSARSKSRDARRLADVRQLASALELYFNDNNGYPAGNNGQPVNLTPMYIGLYPTTPAPADGPCTNWYNTYWYEPKGKAHKVSGKEVFDSYELAFCLGKDVGGYKAGVAKLTPTGIQDSQPCVGTDEQCKANNQAEPEKTRDEQIKEFIDKLDYNAEIRTDMDYSNYGKEQQLQAPSEYFDLMKVLGSAQSKSRDAKRLADVRQLASALELYFNDKGKYPANLSDLTPNYIGATPASPTPVDGTCGEEDNKYNYKLANPPSNRPELKNLAGKDAWYELSFCMGGDTGGYTAGKHELSPAGIK